MSKEDKEAKKPMEEITTEIWQKVKRRNWKNIKKATKQQGKAILVFLYAIKMSEKTLIFDEVEINRNRSHGSKQPIDLNLVHVHMSGFMKPKKRQ